MLLWRRKPLVPLQVEFYALEGMSSLLQTVEAVRGRLIRA
jgi:cellulose biosynthesis protein BcsQ